jgi:hypothetical protein
MNRVKYILTWVALVGLLTGGILLVAISWNGLLSGTPSPVFMMLLWALISASGIYLFFQAAKKTHRQWVDEVRHQKEVEAEKEKQPLPKKDASGDKQHLDFAAVARKVVRRIPEDKSLEETGKSLLKNLAKELELMAGVFYIRKKEQYEAIATFAMASHEEPYIFREGEGLTGQAARNQQLMVLTRLPEEHLEVYSGLGKSKPAYLAIVPLILKNKTVAVLECSGYRHDPHDIENMLRIMSRDLMEKLSSNQ